MQLGCGVTAVARRVPRLAGLVWIPVTCIAKTAIRQQASWLAIKAGVDVNLRWFFCRGSAPAPHTAPIGRGTVRGEASWLRSYRRSATGLAARRSGVDSCYLHSKDRHSATGLMARIKASVDIKPHWLFAGALPLHPDCALWAQRHRETCGLAAELPPWHDGCHGSPVWCGFLLLA